MAFLGRYGGFPPHKSIHADYVFLRSYADAVGKLIEQETKGLKK